MKLREIETARIIRDPLNPRKEHAAQEIEALAESMRRHGIKVPLIGYEIADQPGDLALGDGHCRLEAAILLGLKTVPVIVLLKKPDEAEILATQLTINSHRHSLNPVDECAAFTRLAELNHWSPSQLAAGLAITNSEVTRVLSISEHTEEVRQWIREGKISKSAAYALARMPSVKRAEFARKAASGEVTRDQLNAHVRKKAKTDAVKSQRVRCALPGGTITVQAPAGVNVGGTIELLELLLAEFRKFRTQGLDISTVARVLRDRHQQSPTGQT